MGFFKNLLRPKEQRNYAVAGMRRTGLQQPQYTNWTVTNAVKEGFERNSAVYRAVYLKAKAGSSVPWYVVNAKDEKVEGHHLTRLMEYPNPFISRQDLMELVISWLELSGNSYLKKVTTGGRTSELWPFSPDRIKPVSSSDPEKWFEGYAIDSSRKASIEPDEIIHHKYFNPANPLLGISPLQATGKVVDVDNSQVDFNAATSQNRGVVDGYFTFDRAFNDISETDAIRDKLNEVHKQKRTFGVLGSNAKYIRTALTPAEMDFRGSRGDNKEEIFITFGVPPVYAGITKAASLNNYRTSELIFWFGTMLFLLDDIQDTFNFSLRNELKLGERIIYDVSNVPAVRSALLDKTKTAEILHKMGVPFEQLNSKFGFGFTEFDGWEESQPATSVPTSTPTADSVRTTRKVLEVRSISDIIEESDKYIDTISSVLSAQKESVFDLIAEKGLNVTEAQIKAVLKNGKSLMSDALISVYTKVAEDSIGETKIETRGVGAAAVLATFQAALRDDIIIATEGALIEETTLSVILAKIELTIMDGGTSADLQQMLIDSGVFEPSRALAIARTSAGTAANMSSLYQGKELGATHKTWMTATSHVRDTHIKMKGVTVKIDEDFKVNGHPAQFPLDPRLPASERVNCRCALKYTIED